MLLVALDGRSRVQPDDPNYLKKDLINFLDATISQRRRGPTRNGELHADHPGEPQLNAICRSEGRTPVVERDLIRHIAAVTDRSFVVFRVRCNAQAAGISDSINYSLVQFLRELDWIRHIALRLTVRRTHLANADDSPGVA